MAFTEDLTAFFRTEDFAVSATYAGSTIKVIFEAPYYESISGVVEGTQPTALCRTADVSGARHGDNFAVGSTTYKIVGVEPDGSGVTRLRLQEQ